MLWLRMLKTLKSFWLLIEIVTALICKNSIRVIKKYIYR